VPQWNTISISGYHIREAGSTAAEEVGFTLANGIAYVQAAVNAGLDVDDFAPRLSFFFNAFTDLLEEVGKFRAARRLWAKIMRERFKAKNPKSWMLRFHTQTAGSTLTAQQPDNNIVRVAIQGLAAVLGGTQSLHTNSRDEALALPSEESARIALRTQQIIAHESGVAETVDPLAGSYYVEATTDRIEREAAALIDKIDELGGVIPAIEQGFIQASIQQSAYVYQKDIESEKRIIVGVNKFNLNEPPPKGLLRISKAVEENQITKLRKIKAERDNARVNTALAELKKAAQSEANLMPFILEAVRGYASVGEICNTLREVFGEYKEHIIL
jgi:methylmalonyl-CoA mutase N-terminal domain/subunit